MGPEEIRNAAEILAGKMLKASLSGRYKGYPPNDIWILYEKHRNEFSPMEQLFMHKIIQESIALYYEAVDAVRQTVFRR